MSTRLLLGESEDYCTEILKFMLKPRAGRVKCEGYLKAALFHRMGIRHKTTTVLNK